MYEAVAHASSLKQSFVMESLHGNLKTDLEMKTNLNKAY